MQTGMVGGSQDLAFPQLTHNFLAQSFGFFEGSTKPSSTKDQKNQFVQFEQGEVHKLRLLKARVGHLWALFVLEVYNNGGRGLLNLENMQT